MKIVKIIRSIIGVILSIAVLCLFGVIAFKVATMNKKYYVSDKGINVAILTYHEIVPDPGKVKIDYMHTYAEKFENQVTELEYLGFNIINYSDLISFYEGEESLPPYCFIITFDDGYESVYENAYPIIKSREIPVTIFVIDEKVGTEGYLNWQQLKEMEESGLVDVYTHGLDHEDSTTLSAQELLNRINKAQDDLITNLGKANRPKVFAYPYGKYTEEQFELLKENGYIQNLMDDQTNVSDKTDLYKLHRSYAYNDSVLELAAKQVIRGLK